MKNEDVAISKVDVVFGDAKFTFIDVEYIKSEQEPVYVKKKEGRLYYHEHSYYEMHIITAGTAHYQEEDLSIAVERGKIIIIPPNRAHYPILAQDYGQNSQGTFDGARDLCLSLALEMVEGEVGYYSYFQESLQSIAGFPMDLPPLLMEKFLTFNDYYKKLSLRDHCLQKTAAYELITGLFDHINGFQTTLQQCTTLNKENDKTLILEVLINDPSYPLYLIAQKLGYSVRHTARLIQQIYGRNLSEIRQLKMVNSAKRLLVKSPRLSLEKIAKQSGFSDTETMQRIFLKWEKVTPTEYRKGNT